MTIYHLIISYILFFSVCLGENIPFWVKHPPKHNDYLYGVGISNRFVDDQDSFSEAKIGAVENISRQFQVQIIAGLARVSSGSVSSSEYFTHQIIDSTSYRRINNNMIVIDSILTNDNALILSIINKDLSMPSIDKIQHNDFKFIKKYSERNNPNPSWIEDIPIKEGYIYGIGEGYRYTNLKDSWDNSAKKARLNVAQQVETSHSSLHMNYKGLTSVNIKWIEERTNVILHNSVIRERWYDKQNNLYYTLVEYPLYKIR